MRKYLFTYMACLMMLLTGLSACSSDGDASDNTGGGGASKICTLHFTISPASGGGVGSRSDLGSRTYTQNTPDSWEVGTTAENMKSWIVVFVKSDEGKDKGNIAAVVSNDQVAQGKDKTDDVTVTGLEEGATYQVYSFANISSSELGALAVGSKAPNFSSMQFAVNGNDFGVSAAGSKGIPMSNVQSIKVGADGKAYDSNDATKEVDKLWVVRMLSKITLKFKNISSSDIVVDKVSISDITSNPASDAKNLNLLPATTANAEQIAQAKTNLADNATKAEFTHTIGEGSNGLTIAKTVTDYDSSDDGAHCVSFYVNESQAGSQYPYFVVTLETNVGTQRYFMYTDWKQIARNDHHVLKMALSDYKLRLKVEGFSAIGMMPSLEDDGKQLNLTFHMPDEEFHIIPEVTKYSDSDNTSVSFTDLKWERLEESEKGAEAKAFSPVPAIVKGENRIEGVTLGELGKKIGPIIYQLSVKVNDGSTDALTLVYRVALTQDISWYTNNSRRHGAFNLNYERKFYRYE